MENKSTNEILGLKSIAQSQKLRLGEKLKEQMSLGWIFEKWHEKFILVALCILGLWKIMGWIFG